MNRNRIAGRLLALVLTLGTVLSLTPFPTAAAEEEETTTYPQITISPNSYVSTPEDDAAKNNAALRTELATRFWAYQIFTGTIDADDYVENRDINGLTDVSWGVSITNENGLLEALSGDPTPASELGFTFALMLETKDSYLNEEKDYEYFENYAKEYFDPDNWQPSGDDSGGEVGGTPTGDGKSKLEKAFNEDLKKLTIGNVFTTALNKNVGGGINRQGAHTAAQIIADFTPATGNLALAQAFYAIVFDRYEYGNNEVGKYKYLNEEPFQRSSWVGTDGETGYWTIGAKDSNSKNHLPAGYYMIRDAYSEGYDGPGKSLEGKAKASYMAGVYGSGHIDVKAEAPRVTKTIGGSNNGINAACELGEAITFTLTGTLPENYYTGYDGYPYTFEDTLDKGLTFKGITRVYVKVPDSNGNFGTAATGRYYYYEVERYTGGESGNTGNGYRFEPNANDDGTTTVKVIFPNLKNVKGKKVTSTSQTPWKVEGGEANLIPITGKSEIYVVYTAALNEHVNITTPSRGNSNTVRLYYANSPLWDPEGAVEGGTWDSEWEKAPRGMVSAFTATYDFGVQLKVYGAADPDAGGNEERTPLADAGFALKKSSGDNVQYAILHKVETKELGAAENQNSDLAKYTYYLAGWASEDALFGYLAGDTVTKTWGEKLTAGAKIGDFTVPSTASSRAAESQSGEADADGGYYAAVMTQPDGLVRIVGMDSSSTYYLEEVVTPDGCATVHDISVRFTSIFASARGNLVHLSAAVEHADEVVVGENGEIVNDKGFASPYSELVARFAVYSDPTIEVNTGGRGTALFYISGAALLAGAALLLIFSSVKNKEPEKSGRRHNRI